MFVGLLLHIHLNVFKSASQQCVKENKAQGCFRGSQETGEPDSLGRSLTSPGRACRASAVGWKARLAYCTKGTSLSSLFFFSTYFISGFNYHRMAFLLLFLDSVLLIYKTPDVTNVYFSSIPLNLH